MSFSYLVGSFCKSRRGNVAVLFALFVFPLLLGAGIGLDLMRASQVRGHLAEAADSGLLAAARAKMLDSSLTDEQAKAIARKYFDNNYKSAQASISISTFNFVSVKSGDTTTYKLTATGKVDTTLLKLAGRDYLPININSEAAVAPPRALEVVMVLDNTQSMFGTRIDALKVAAKDLVNKVMKDTDNQTKLGIVPFGEYVNIGTSRRNETWLDVPSNYSNSWTNCWNTYPDRVQTGTEWVDEVEQYNCRQVNSHCWTDGRRHSCQKTECDERTVSVERPVYDDGDPVQQCHNGSTDHEWHGCVGSRDYPKNTQDNGYGMGNRIPGLLDIWCGQEVTPLTTTKSTVISAIESMSVKGYTYIPSGLSWGWRLLSNTAPFTEGETYANIDNDGGMKALILMTDGANTRSSSYPKHDGWDVNDANTITSELCVAIKAKNIQVYTIAFEVTDNTIKTLLENCATTTDDYFDATDAAALSEAFEGIANSLTELALTK